MSDAKKNPLGPTGEQVRLNVERIREAQGLSKKDLSDRVATLGRPIPPLGISRIEAGARRVDADDLVALAAALSVSPVTLLLPHQEPTGAPDDPHRHWLPVTGLGNVPWETAWRWMHGEWPPADVDVREIRRFRETNRPYEDDNPATEVENILRVRVDGAWRLEAERFEEGGTHTQLIRRGGSARGQATQAPPSDTDSAQAGGGG